MNAPESNADGLTAVEASPSSGDALAAAVEANEICVSWVGDFWVWCCQRHGEGVAWLSDNPADDPAGREEIAAHLAEHVAFDAQPRQVARRAIIDVLTAPRFWTDHERADAVLDVAEPILLAAGREAAATAIGEWRRQDHPATCEYCIVREAAMEDAARIARGDDA